MSTKLVGINDDVREMLSSIAEKNGFKKFYLEVTEGISKGDGYIGLARNVRIHNSIDPEEILSLHVKSASREKGMREILPIPEMFSTEIYMYNTIFPYFKDLELRKGLTPSNCMPRHFGSILNDRNEVIILENLKEIGYSMYDCSKPLDSQHIRLVITEYAKYHSLSFALREQQPEVFENLQPKLYNSFEKSFHKDFKNTIINKCNSILSFLDEDDSKRLKSFLENIESELKEVLSPLIDEYSVILHGDCWTNNMLFKYPEGNSNPTDICLIDFQMARLAPPVLDLTYFFFICSSEQDISQCKEYLKLYYKILSQHLQKLGCDPNILYPYSVFMNQWKKFAKFCIIVAPIVLIVMLRTESEIVDLEELVKMGLPISELFDCDIKNNEKFNSRFTAIISYLAKNDLL